MTDPATAEALKPWYRQFCKRPCFHDEYLQAFNRPNVTLVDTEGRGIDRITPNGVVVGEQEYQVDCLIYATGFEVGTDYTRRAGYDVVGPDGVSLSEYWRDGMRSLHGMHVHGFPNMFVLGHTQGGFTVNYPHLLEEASAHLAHIVRHAIDHDLSTVEATEEGEADWLVTLAESARDIRTFQEQCTPGYYNNEGQPGCRRVPRELLRERPDALLPTPGRLERRRHVHRTGAARPIERPASAAVIGLQNPPTIALAGSASTAVAAVATHDAPRIPWLRPGRSSQL